jgi:Outer membrane protein beta-barrel domain
MFRSTIVVVSLVVAVVTLPTTASAQGFGIGPRVSFVRGDLTTSTPSTRLIGGTIRMKASPHTALELALDHRSSVNPDGTERVRETPFQMSLLMFPARGTFSPYLLAGVGIYTHHTDELGLDGKALSTASERKTGWHLGFGAELYVSRHAAFFGDYRFRFVRFGSQDGAESIPVPGLRRLSHKGSMWTSGIAFYF